MKNIQPLIESRIFLIRGQKVLLDSDLAALYDVETKALNQAVRRNRERFPEDFLFQLSGDESECLRSQFVTSNRRGGRRYAPYAFTEQGVAMLSSVLKSKRAIEVNIAIMRTFVRLRHLLTTHEELARRLDQLTRQPSDAWSTKVSESDILAKPSRSALPGHLQWRRQSEQGHRIEAVFETIQHLIETPPEEPAKRRIGFPTDMAPNQN